MPRDAAALAWMANLACLELHPYPVRADDLDHPDELRVDLDPVPGVEWPQIVQVADVVREVQAELGLAGWPKTSGSRGIHVLMRIERRWSFDAVRRAPTLATSKWWKEERHGVFVDYNQNAKDRTVASAYSVRPKPDARVSAPVAWDELRTCAPADFTLRTTRAAREQDVLAGLSAGATRRTPWPVRTASSLPAGRSGNPPPACRRASAGIRRRGGSGCLAGGRT